MVLSYSEHCFPDNTEMPDAMDVIFQSALEYGKSGAVSISIQVSLFISVETCTIWMLPWFTISMYTYKYIKENDYLRRNQESSLNEVTNQC